MNDARRLIATFLALTLVLSLPSYWAAASGGTLGIFSVSLMWAPGVAAMLTMLVYRRSLSGLGWRPSPVRYLLLAYVLPIVYCLAVYVPTWLGGLGAFDTRLVAERVGLDGATGVLVYVLLSATAFFVLSMLTATGEEIGWRGLLVPQLARVTSFTRVALISGAIWALWHLPLVLLADYNAGTTAWYSVVYFVVLVVAISFPFAWLRLKSGSLWTGAVLHASHNLFVQQVFDDLTADTGGTRLIVGEFGIGLMLAGVVVAYVFWRLWSRDHSAAVIS